jgi:hypothetical protein
MDQFLDAMYGTRENIAASPDISALEKNAEAELLVNTLKAEGWDPTKIDSMSGDEVLKVAHALFGDKSSLVQAAQPAPAAVKTAAAPPPFVLKKKEEGDAPAEKCKDCDKEKCECPPAAKEAAETLETKLAHADYLGRVMAHSFVDEMAQMEKKAQYEQVLQEKIAQAQANTTPKAPAEEDLAAKLAAKVEPQLTDEQQLEAMVEGAAAEKIAAMQTELTPEQQFEALVEQRVQEKLAAQSPLAAA